MRRDPTGGLGMGSGRCGPVWLLVLALLLGMALAAQAEQDGPVLHIAGWDVYADPDNKNKTIGYRSFENETGIRIEFTPLAHLEEIVDVAESSARYDLFIISNEGIRILHDMGLVVPLDLKKLPHYQNLHHQLRYTEWALFESRVYAVPWAWGPTGLLYDTEAMPEPDSWSLLWDEKYLGRVALWDDVSMIWTVALALGYQNVYSLTRKQLDEVKNKLLELNKNVYGYYRGEQEAIEFVTRHEVVALNSWFDPSRRLRAQGHKFEMVIPREGAVGMFDSYMISAESRLQEESYHYINHQISPVIQQKMVRITGLEPANIEALALLEAGEIRALHLDEADYFSRMLLWDNMPRKHLYEQVLQEVRADLAARRERQEP